MIRGVGEVAVHFFSHRGEEQASAREQADSLGKDKAGCKATTSERGGANILRNPKDKIELENQGVYEIPCKVCPATYIGQTNRRISARIAEHKNAVKKEEKSSSLFQHIKTTGHEIDFERTKLISKTEHFNSRIIMEAIEIEKHPNNMNKRDDTSRLPDI
ncbi:hypothetical protein JRQ81_019498 [Phrynocephalus forsythii]|uniref:GIY-YIG domain-containing protein n=1 Tax=Phrynocephalus forsythii TaxID=171643 RepID=A0A9Q1AYL0_9SAUR|nr:hypothetical protein JRQ81_019498 [Phrynocephalus forsythii]